MDVSALGALNLYTYQTALQKASRTSSADSARNQAVLQTLTSAYASTTASGSGDSFSSLVGSSGVLGSLMSGIYSTASSSGSISSLTGLATSLAGSDTSASGLLASVGSGGLAGISSAALNPTATLAMAAYTSQSGTLTQSAKAAAANINASDSSGIQEAIQTAQATLFAGTLDLLG